MRIPVKYFHMKIYENSLISLFSFFFGNFPYSSDFMNYRSQLNILEKNWEWNESIYSSSDVREGGNEVATWREGGEEGGRGWFEGNNLLKLNQALSKPGIRLTRKTRATHKTSLLRTREPNSKLAHCTHWHAFKTVQSGPKRRIAHTMNNPHTNRLQCDLAMSQCANHEVTPTCLRRYRIFILHITINISKSTHTIYKHKNQPIPHTEISLLYQHTERRSELLAWWDQPSIYWSAHRSLYCSHMSSPSWSDRGIAALYEVRVKNVLSSDS